MDDILYPVAHRTDQEIEALKFRYQTFDEDSIPRVIRHAGFTAVSWRKPESWSTSHVIYIVAVRERVREVVVRANIGWGNPEHYMTVEKLITDRVAALGIPVNRILFSDTTRNEFPFDYQIQDALEGSDIEASFHGTRADYDQLSFDLGAYVARWGDLAFDGFGRFDTARVSEGVLAGTKTSMYDYMTVMLDDDIRRLVDAGVLSLAQSESVRNAFETYKPVMNVKTATLVQYDLADHNIMFDGAHTITGIFDWEAAVSGDPMLDLASAPTWKCAYPREEKMIEGYKSVRALPNFFKEKLEIYRLRTMLWKMVYALRAGILNDDRKRKFDAALAPFRI